MSVNDGGSSPGAYPFSSPSPSVSAPGGPGYGAPNFAQPPPPPPPAHSPGSTSPQGKEKMEIKEIKIEEKGWEGCVCV